MLATVLQLAGLVGLCVAGALVSVPLALGAVSCAVIYVGLALEDR